MARGIFALQSTPELVYLASVAGVVPGPFELAAHIDLDKDVQASAFSPVALEVLLPANRKAGVPDSRTLSPLVHTLTQGGIHAATPLASTSLAELAKLQVNVDELIAAASAAKAPAPNTQFEEITCVGLNTETDTLGAVVHIKKSSGYGGTLCQSGSTEYVSFWADWGDTGSVTTYLGTGMVQVHDIASIPAGGLYYGVVLPGNFSSHLEACSSPNLVRIRAVLSWASPPSTTDPNAPTAWGNRLDVAVQIRPGAATTELTGVLAYIGNVPLSNISTSTYLAYPSAGVIDPTSCAGAADRPFAGATNIGAVVFNFPVGALYYSVQFAPHGSPPASFTPVMTGSYSYILTDPTHPPNYQQTKTYTSSDGWYLYQDDPAADQVSINNQIATWNTTTVPDGTYDIVLAYTMDYPITASSNIRRTAVTTVVVSNRDFTVSPTANAAVDTGYDVDIVIDGGDCHSYAKMETINGHLRVRNPFFGVWTLELQPSTHTHGAHTVPTCAGYASLADQGPASAAWSLDTSLLDKCGYTVTLHAWDRAIVNSNAALEHTALKAVGFSVI
jgi:hypothetical protein